jgi:hypothetical protein
MSQNLTVDEYTRAVVTILKESNLDFSRFGETIFQFFELDIPIIEAAKKIIEAEQAKLRAEEGAASLSEILTPQEEQTPE